MKCNLCLEDKPLIKKSHIIPDFMYKGLFDSKHFINFVNLNKIERPKKLPDGFYDKHILCRSCDNVLLGNLETYSSKTIYGGQGLKAGEAPKFQTGIGKDGLKSVVVSDIDYRKFKLFLLSILWRSHISTHVFFKGVNLGKYAELIRTMILNQNPGNEDEFETCLVYLDSLDIPADSIIEPVYLKIDGNSSYVFLINRILYHFNLSQQNKLPIFELGRVRKINKMEVAWLEGNFANGYFDSFLQKKLRKRH